MNLRDPDGLSGIDSKMRALDASDYGAARYADNNNNAAPLLSSLSADGGTVEGRRSGSGGVEAARAAGGEAVAALRGRVIQHDDEGNWKHAIACYEKALNFIAGRRSSSSGSTGGDGGGNVGGSGGGGGTGADGNGAP